MKITILTASYNCEDTILDCIKAVDDQSFVNLEHIVVDGKSEDATLNLLSAQLKPNRIIVSEKDKGLYDALNKGLALSSGDVVGILHADDVYADSEVLSRVSEYFTNPEVLLIYGDLVYVDKVDLFKIVRNWISGKFPNPNLKKGWMPPHPTLFLRRSLYDKVGSFDKRYKISADYDFILRIFSHLTPEQVVYIPEVLVKMRTGGVSNRSFKHLMQKSWEDYQIIRRHKIGGLGTLFRKNISKLPQFFYKMI
jgi:glycosyltransferase